MEHFEMDTAQPLNISPFFRRKSTLNCRGRLIDLSAPLVMGIINLTPDSFYAPSCFKGITAVLNQVDDIISQGGDMVDIGACSSRPGSVPVTIEEEVDRLMPVLEATRKRFPELVISVDTFRAGVAEKAVQYAGADIINDISGGELDEEMFNTVSRLKVPYVLMHMKGTPLIMQDNPLYDNVVAEISLWLARKVEMLRAKGVNDIIIDPGFGFGKTIEHNFRLLDGLDQFNLFELPLLVGLSRKSMIYKTVQTGVDGALNGTTVLNTVALLKGADILRVHDVREAAQCVRLIKELRKVSGL